jgi:hypothetical protein
VVWWGGVNGLPVQGDSPPPSPSSPFFFFLLLFLEWVFAPHTIHLELLGEGVDGAVCPLVFPLYHPLLPHSLNLSLALSHTAPRFPQRHIHMSTSQWLVGWGWVGRWCFGWLECEPGGILIMHRDLYGCCCLNVESFAMVMMMMMMTMMMLLLLLPAMDAFFLFLPSLRECGHHEGGSIRDLARSPS